MTEAKLNLAGEEDGPAFKSTFYHGPVALTSAGPKFVRTYAVTTLDRSDWDPMVGMMLGAQADEGMGVIDPTGYHLRGGLKEGVAYLSDEPTPLLEMLGPMLDEEIDWDGLIEALGEPEPGL